ncbi:MAG: hypothetical protein KKA32_15810 [Actinobacteria bacterium]|nr:hypothetical protein [Actinomycetota bacterium]
MTTRITPRGLLRALGLLRTVRVPGLPVAPRFLALIAIRNPRLVPYPIRWRTAARGLGLVVARLVEAEGGGDGGEKARGTGAVLQGVGLDQGRALRAQLDYGRDPAECARVVALANRVYDIDAVVVEAGSHEARVVTPGCPWSREAWWGPGPCGAFSRYEVGLVAGLNPEVRLRYECKRTRGDDTCVGVYTWRAGTEATSLDDADDLFQSS